MPELIQDTAAEMVVAAQEKRDSFVTGLMKKIDKDGDGNLSLNEMEDAAKEGWMRLRDMYLKAKMKVNEHKWACQLGIGYVAVMYGGNFTHTFLCASSFQASQMEILQKNVEELVDVTLETREKFVDQVGDDAVLVSTNDKKVSVPTNTVIALLSCIDPNRVMNVLRSVYSSLLVGIVAAVNDNAAKFGLGCQIGERISTFLLSMADKFIAKAEEKLAEQEKEDVLKAQSWAWTKLGIKSVCTSLGVFISWRLKDMAAVWATCQYGGVKMAKAMFHVIKHEDDALAEMVGLAIGWYGFAFHLRHFSKPSLPTVLALPLAPVTLIETALRTMALGAGNVNPAA